MNTTADTALALAAAVRATREAAELIAQIEQRHRAAAAEAEVREAEDASNRVCAQAIANREAAL